MNGGFTFGWRMGRVSGYTSQPFLATSLFASMSPPRFECMVSGFEAEFDLHLAAVWAPRSHFKFVPSNVPAQGMAGKRPD